MTKSKSNLSLFAWLLAVGFLALNIFQWYQNNQLSSALTAKEQLYTEAQKVQGELETDYQASLASLEEMRGDNQELNELIETQVTELKGQKDKINGLIWTKKELGKAKEELEAMNSRVSGYLAEIQQLKDSNSTLTATNQKLNSDNEILNTDLNKSKEDISRLDSTRVVLVSLSEELTNANEKLSDKVDMAEAIKINAIGVEGFKKKSTGDLKSTSKAKNIQVLRTCITTETNMVTAAGDELFYVRIVTPQGETITGDSGGILKNKMTMNEVRYTTSGTVKYEQKDTNFCIDYPLAMAISAGTYDIEVYNKEYMVGKGSFRLK